MRVLKTDCYSSIRWTMLYCLELLPLLLNWTKPILGMERKLPMIEALTKRPQPMDKRYLFTIGFSKRSAESFFEALRVANIKTLIDVRLKNSSQLAGFTQGRDLPYFLRKLCSCEYRYCPSLAPTDDILTAYKQKKITWEQYENLFKVLLIERDVKKNISSDELDQACLLCSEASANKCHRRIVAEYLQNAFPCVSIWHL